MYNVALLLLGVLIGGCIERYRSNKSAKDIIKKKQALVDKNMELFLLMNQWVKNRQQEKRLCSYFESNGYKKIAVYGMSYVGERLVDELENSTVKVEYGIDCSASALGSVIYTPDDKLPNVDVVVVTAISYFGEIRNMLKDKVKCPIVSLEDIIFEL